jgi:thiol-disulfide isomerase/thioredoxin
MNQRDTTYAKRTALAGAVFLIVAAVLDYWPVSNPLHWISFREAREIAASQNRPIFVDVYTDWCGPCKMMDRVVFPDDSVKGLLTSRYVLAKINGDDPVLGDSLKGQFGIRAYPTYIVLGPTGKERKRHVGFMAKSPMVRWLSDSVGVQILQWPDLEKAVGAAQFSRRRVMVLILQSGDDIEATDRMIEEQQLGPVIDKYFVPTLLVRGNAGEEKLLDRVGASPKTGMREIIVLDEKGKAVGRFFITLQMQFDKVSFTSKLYEFAAR